MEVKNKGFLGFLPLKVYADLQPIYTQFVNCQIEKCQPRSPTGAPTAAVEAPVRKRILKLVGIRKFKFSCGNRQL